MTRLSNITRISGSLPSLKERYVIAVDGVLLVVVDEDVIRHNDNRHWTQNEI